MCNVRALGVAIVVIYVACVSNAPGQPCSTQIIEANPSLVIQDVGTTIFDLQVDPNPLCPLIDDLDVGLVIPHTWQGNLVITLTHLDTDQSTLLFDQPGAPQDGGLGFHRDNYGNFETGEKFMLDDEADGVYDSPPFGTVPSGGITNVTGAWRPEGDLSVFDGESREGTWRFTIVDFAGGDFGTLETVSLHITGVPEPSSLALLGLAASLCRRRTGVCLTR